MRVVFASGIDDFCHRYGPVHWAEQLATQGIASTVRAHTDPRLLLDLETHDLLVLYRVPWSGWIAHLVEHAHALGRTAVFAIDDLIIDPALADVPSLRGASPEERALWQDGVRRYRQTLEACDAFLATSEPLAEAGRALGVHTFVHRAGLGARELALGARASLTRGPRPFRLGYFSGTATHNEDLRTITTVLGDFLTRHPTTEVVLAGHVDADSALDRFGARVVRAPYMPWTALPAAIAHVDVSVAPLEWRHPFVAAKGAIKYLEAAAVGVPVIASPTEAYRHALQLGENGCPATGFLAADLEQWTAALETCVADPAIVTRVGRAARRDVEERFTPARQGAELAAMLDAVASRDRRRTLPPGRASSGAPSSTVGEDVASELALVARFPEEVARAARESSDWPILAATEVRGTTEPLGDGVVLSQAFLVSGGAITRVDVWTISYGQRLDHVLEVRLVDDEGRTRSTRTVPAALVPNASWFAIDVERSHDPQPTATVRSYALELRAHGTGVGNAVSFGTTPAVAMPPHTRNAAPAGATLALRVFADGTVPATVTPPFVTDARAAGAA